MYRALALMTLVLCFGSISRTASAQSQQCGGQSPGITAQCQGGSCFGYYTSQPSTGSSIIWTVQYLECCGERVPSWVSTVNHCPYASVRLPLEKARLELLASKGIKLMVLDCTGHFARYAPDGTAQEPDDILSIEPLGRERRDALHLARND